MFAVVSNSVPTCKINWICIFHKSLHLLLSTISSLVKLPIRKQYSCLTSAQFSLIFSGLDWIGLDWMDGWMDGWMGWMRAAERYGDLQGLNKAETTNKYGEEKVGPALYKKLFFF